MYYDNRLQNGVQSIKKNGSHQLRTSDKGVSLKVFGNAEADYIAAERCLTLIYGHSGNQKSGKEAIDHEHGENGSLNEGNVRQV